jgi:hypothetical protein
MLRNKELENAWNEIEKGTLDFFEEKEIHETSFYYSFRAASSYLYRIIN